MPYWVYANKLPVRSFHTQEAAFEYVNKQIAAFQGGCYPPVYTVYYGEHQVKEGN
jgi:hypothetical protein